MGEPAEEVSARGGELVAPDESTVAAEPLLDAIVVEDRQSNGGLADTAGANEGDWVEVLNEIDYLLG